MLHLTLRLTVTSFQRSVHRHSIASSAMYPTMTITFLGTSSGGGPTVYRNCSSLVADVLGEGSLWMFDCAEGTLRQFLFQPYSSNKLRVARVTKIFVTHMHADHVMGIVPLLRNVLRPPSIDPVQKAATSTTTSTPSIELYGPAGLRTFIRSIMKMTLTRTLDKYTVHELLKESDAVTPCEPSDILHSSELAGSDIRCDKDQFWRGIAQGTGYFGPVFLDAGPISHRDPCIGYVIRESAAPFRKVVILGDTYDPSNITLLCTNPSPSLLIHEATDAYISPEIDPKAKRSFELVEQTTLARGHSYPQMAGTFARKIGAHRLILNHIGGRFRQNAIAEMERQASEAWGMGQARVANDYMSVIISA